MQNLNASLKLEMKQKQNLTFFMKKYQSFTAMQSLQN